MGKYANFLELHFDNKGAFLSRTSKPIFEGSADTVSYADRERSISDHLTITNAEKYDELVKGFDFHDPGHSGNVRVMRSAAKTAFEGCV